MPDNLYLFARHAYIYTNPTDHPVSVRPHSAAVLLSAYGKPFRVNLGSCKLCTQAIVIAPLVLREVLARQAGLVGFYILPGSSLFRRFAEVDAKGYRLLDRCQFNRINDELVALYEGHAEAEQVLSAYRLVTSRFKGNEPDQALLRQARELMKQIEINPDISLRQLAADHHLTYTWMSRLFTHVVGLSLREYKNWLKHKKVFELLQTGMSLTDIAQHAGFTDSAHLSRIYKRWYGNPPSYVRKRKNVKFFSLDRD